MPSVRIYLVGPDNQEFFHEAQAKRSFAMNFFRATQATQENIVTFCISGIIDTIGKIVYNKSTKEVVFGYPCLDIHDLEY